MKPITTTLSFAFFLVFGVFAYTQEPSDNNKPRQQEEQKPEVKPEQAKPPEQEEPKPSKQAKPKREQPSKQESAKRGHEEHDQNTGQAEEHDQNTVQARQRRAADKGGHIPDDKFRASFGRQHTIIINQPVIVEGRPRFQSGSYWFEIVEPWPADWAYSDDCYIDYVDGDYFLFDLLHPGERVVVFVVL